MPDPGPRVENLNTVNAKKETLAGKSQETQNSRELCYTRLCAPCLKSLKINLETIHPSYKMCLWVWLTNSGLVTLYIERFCPDVFVEESFTSGSVSYSVYRAVCPDVSVEESFTSGFVTLYIERVCPDVSVDEPFTGGFGVDVSCVCCLFIYFRVYPVLGFLLFYKLGYLSF